VDAKVATEVMTQLLYRPELTLGALPDDQLTETVGPTKEFSISDEVFDALRVLDPNVAGHVILRERLTYREKSPISTLIPMGRIVRLVSLRRSYSRLPTRETICCLNDSNL
jgi:hypothetical protein